MKFLCLGYLDVDSFDAAPEEVKQEILGACDECCRELRATGKVLAEEGLPGPATSRSIRPSKGRPRVTDGPFIETKEQLGGFFVVEAEDIDQAVEIASLHPAARLGEEYGFGIEVRPIRT